MMLLCSMVWSLLVPISPNISFSPVVQDGILSGGNEFYPCLFQSGTTVPHHWFTSQYSSPPLIYITSRTSKTKVKLADDQQSRQGKSPNFFWSKQLIGPTSMLVLEHLNPSCAHIILQISLPRWIVFEPKFYAQILYQCIVSSLWTRANKTGKPVGCKIW